MPADPRTIAEGIAEGIVEEDCVCPRCTLARAYLALLPPAGAWSHDEGDVVLTHPDGSTERFYAGERAPFIVAACSRYEALVSDLPVVIEAAERDAQLAEDEAFYERDDPGGDVEESDFLCERAKEVRAAIERLRAGVGEAAGGREKGRG